ncbi:protein CASC1 [Nephila pilipes]|uniref:Protein CASC1 n=1 Tax=Nephila pilipes TaxID=299642 RepID=A0A8X6N2R8_NEPPI|nr:protein CASC1 [Nephila pilipes]
MHDVIMTDKKNEFDSLAKEKQQFLEIVKCDRPEKLAREEQETLRLLQKEERLRREEEAEEDQKRSEQETEIEEYVQMTSKLRQHKRVEDWEQKRWHDYLYRTKELDSLQLPVVNAFITRWEDDLSYETQEIFRKSLRSLQGIVNLKETIGKKLDYLSFMLLKNANQYLDEKTQNMEYSYKEGVITLCLWANIHRAVRRRGMNRLGIRFWIPTDLASDDCAIRVMKVECVPSLPELEVTQQKDLEMDQSSEISQIQTKLEQKVPSDKVLSADNVEKNSETEIVENMNGQMETVQSADAIITDQRKCFEQFQTSAKEFTPTGSTDILLGENQSLKMSGKSYSDEEDKRRETFIKPPSKVDEDLVDLNEFLLTGGLFHFDLFEVPKLTTEKNGFTYIYKQKRIFIETDRFGIFGLFQKRNINLPYKSWCLSARKAVELSLVGQHLTLRIEISNEGCRLQSIRPGKFDLPHLLGTIVWMTPDQMIEKLLSIGINIAYNKRDPEFIGKLPKNRKMEEITYNSMALLSTEYDFSWSQWNLRLPPDCIAVNYRKASPKDKGEMEADFSNEPADAQQFPGTLFHTILNGSPPSYERFTNNSCCIESVRLLLQKCGLLSFA